MKFFYQQLKSHYRRVEALSVVGCSFFNPDGNDGKIECRLENIYMIVSAVV